MKSIEKDDRGAEYAVDTGFGSISKVDYKERNAAVEFTVPGLRLPVKGWVDHSDPDVARILESPPERVEYRIETRRKDEIDPAIPFDKLGNFDKFRRIVVLRPAGAAPTNGNHSADGPREIPNEPPPQPGPKPNDPPAAPPPPRSGGHPTDTWAYGATLGLAELAFELLVRAGPDKATVTPSSVRGLADRLLAVADAGQRHVRGEVERNANSHTRARGALRAAFELYPPPLEAPDDMNAWQERVTRAVCLLMKVGLDLLEGEPPTA